MACQYFSPDDATSFISDLTEIIEEEKKLSKQLSQFKGLQLKEDRVIPLRRGGIIVKTRIGNVQYGMPPETVKDAINQQIDVPIFYIIPEQRFDKKFGVNVAEFEFPAYYNYFIRKRKINLICDKEAEQAIRIIFQETLLGPVSHENIKEDFFYQVPESDYPDFLHENKIFSQIPEKQNEYLKVDTLLNFMIFDEETGIINITENDKTLQIKREDSILSFIEDGKVIEQVKDVIVLNEDSILEQFENQIPKIRLLECQNSSNDILEEAKTQKNRGSMRNIMIWSDKQAFSKEMKQLGDYIQDNSEVKFTPPDFGISILGSSHGFDPSGSTTGVLVWIYGKGIMVDPPPFSMQYLKKVGIQSNLIRAVIITHCHADHDAGTFHKILEEGQIEIITTPTIMNSFIRKYCALSKIPAKQLQSLYIFRPAIIGQVNNIYGGKFNFFYELHTIPCIGFEIEVDDKRIYFSSDTFYHPNEMKKLMQNKQISESRYKQLALVDFNKYDIIFHEAGVPPIHTPQSVLAELPANIKNKLLLIHSAKKDLQKQKGLKIAQSGLENSIILIPAKMNRENEIRKRLSFLSTMEIFENLTLKNINWLMDSLVIEKVSPGQTIIEEGSVGYKFYIIEYGIARIFSDSNQNKFERFIKSGDYFGESALVSNQGKRMATVQAVTEMILLTLEKHNFWFIFGDGQGGSGPVIRKFLKLSNARKNQAISILQKNSVFYDLSPSQKTQLEMILKEKQVEKNTIMWQVGEQPKFAFLIKRGSFQFVNCEESSIDELEAGTFVGETNCILHEKPLTTSIKSTKKSVIFQILKSDLMKFLRKNPGLQIQFVDRKYFD